MFSTVYPRLRGERLCLFWSPPTSTGLSPASRGTLLKANEAAGISRFIPGFAGNAHVLLQCGLYTPVYPRLRGERVVGFLNRNASGGLSPASRGTRHWKVIPLIRFRFIPGFAGNAKDILIAGDEESVYPRLRGERFAHGNDHRVDFGLSPASRGTPVITNASVTGQRFIPGFAGNAYTCVVVIPTMAVYPRLRGERYARASARVFVVGLSPASRGTR